MTLEQHLLYSLILPSAKRKIKENRESYFHIPVIADHLLIKLILELTTGKSYTVIANQLMKELSAFGFRCDRISLREFVGEMDNLIRYEVAVTTLIYDMQERGNSDKEISDIVSQGFGGRKPLLVVN